VKDVTLWPRLSNLLPTSEPMSGSFSTGVTGFCPRADPISGNLSRNLSAKSAIDDRRQTRKDNSEG
jgi:hypothetical protein